MTLNEYIADKVDMSDPSACWQWHGTVMGNGYGRVILKSHRGSRVAHRAIYEHLMGSTVPKGMHLDHICHDPDLCKKTFDCPHRRCVNPAHLNIVTPKQNADRRVGQFCGRDHEFTPDNIYWQTSSRTGAKVRSCRKCSRLGKKRRRAQRGLAQAS